MGIIDLLIAANKGKRDTPLLKALREQGYAKEGPHPFDPAKEPEMRQGGPFMAEASTFQSLLMSMPAPVQEVVDAARSLPSPTLGDINMPAKLAMAVPAGRKMLPQFAKFLEEAAPVPMEWGALKALERVPEKTSAAHALKQIQSNLTKDEMVYGKVKEYLADNPTVTREGLKKHLEKHLPQFEQKTLRGPANAKEMSQEADEILEHNMNTGWDGPPESNPVEPVTSYNSQFHAHQIPEGTNYRENLTVLKNRNPEQDARYAEILGQIDEIKARGSLDALSPEDRVALRNLEINGANLVRESESAQFTGAHHGEPDLLYHTRTKDIDGGSTHYIDELQSDWHQKGRELGYLEPGASPKKRPLTKVEWDNLDAESQLDHRVGDMVEVDAAGDVNDPAVYPGKMTPTIPSAPFAEDIEKLGLKNEIKRAIEEGKDKVKWSNGKIQAERWGGGEVASVQVLISKRHAPVLVGLDSSGTEVFRDPTVAEDVLDKVRQMGASDIEVESLTKAIRARALPEVNITLPKPHLYEGGSGGLSKVYDEKMVNVANKILAPHGGKVVIEPTKVYTPTIQMTPGNPDNERWGLWINRNPSDYNTSSKLIKRFPSAKDAKAYLKAHPEILEEKLPTIILSPELKQSIRKTGFKISQIGANKGDQNV